MRQIKFRGQIAQDDKTHAGEIVYGFLVIYPEHRRWTHWMHCPDDSENYPVEPESVQQLIAVDKNGREVYEGDTLQNGEAADISDIHSIEMFDLWLTKSLVEE